MLFENRAVSAAGSVAHVLGLHLLIPKLMKEDLSARATTDESFGFLPWITFLLTALFVLIACLVASR